MESLCKNIEKFRESIKKFRANQAQRIN